MKPLQNKIIFLKINMLKKQQNMQFFADSCNFSSKKCRKVETCNYPYIRLSHLKSQLTSSIVNCPLIVIAPHNVLESRLHVTNWWRSGTRRHWRSTSCERGYHKYYYSSSTLLYPQR